MTKTKIHQSVNSFKEMGEDLKNLHQAITTAFQGCKNENTPAVVIIGTLAYSIFTIWALKYIFHGFAQIFDKILPF